MILDLEYFPSSEGFFSRCVEVPVCGCVGLLRYFFIIASTEPWTTKIASSGG